MSLYFVLTVDGDWEEYYDPALPEERRKPDKRKLLAWIDKEIRLSSRMLNGRFVHFVHTSPRAREFFMQPEFVSRWKKIEENKGSVGVHCHEDDPRRAYYFDDRVRMEKAIGFFAGRMRFAGLDPVAYRSGYLAFSPKMIPLLEQNGISLDFSCEPGRHLFHGDLLVSDWRGAPDNYYRMDRNDHRRPGESRLFEIPVGIYVEKDSLWRIWNKARNLAKRKKTTMVSVLAHSFEFGSLLKLLKIKMALLILKKYGTFINAREALKIAQGGERR